MAKISLPDPYPWPVRYGAAVLLSAPAIAISVLLTQHGISVKSAIMLTVITVAAWFGGTGPGFLCFAITFVAEMFLRYPSGSLRVEGLNGQIGLLAFAINATVICILFRDLRIFRAWKQVSPGDVTGGWWWTYDATGEGTVELSSPAFPHLAVTRTYWAWLQQVHPDDRERVESTIRLCMAKGRIDMEFHMVMPNGEVRKVSMSGLRFDRRVQGLTAVCLEMGASQPNPQAFLQ